jgi:hypothetical protein
MGSPADPKAGYRRLIRGAGVWPRSRRWRRLLALTAAAVTAGFAVTACSSHSSANPQARPTAERIVFVSDQSVILPGRDAKYRFSVRVETASSRVLNVPVRWQSSAPEQVAVSADGVAVARAGTGSATIFVSADGARPQAAQVTVAQPASGTLLVPSGDVLSRTQGGATLKRTRQTAALRPGQTVVSGNRGGLLDRVTAVTVGAKLVTIRTTATSLARAFRQLSIHAESAKVTATVPTAALRPHAGTPSPDVVLASASDVGVGAAPGDSVASCTLTSGRNVTVSLDGPSVSVPATVDLVGDLQTRSPDVELFEVAAQATVPVIVHSGSVTVSAAGKAAATCDLGASTIDVPTPIFFGPVEINGQATADAGVDLSVDAGAAMTFSGPTVSDTARGTDGIRYTSAGGWQPVEDNQAADPEVTPGGTSFGASLTATAAPYVRLDFGISGVLGDCAANLCTRLATANLAFTDAEGAWSFGIRTPFRDLAPSYHGPRWNADLDLSAGPELAVGGDIGQLFSWIGVPPPAVRWTAFEDSIPLAGSPDLTVSTAPPNESGAVGLTASVPGGYSGSTVEFIAYPPGGGPGFLAASTQVNGTSARATWQPSARQSGTYRIAALLFDRVFGAVGLPYASAPVPVTLTSDGGGPGPASGNPGGSSPLQPPQITSVETYTQGELVYFSITYADPDNDAEGFGFVGVDGSGWAEENHPFSSPSYGIVGPDSIAYPFNLGCGTAEEIQSQVEAWIYDTAGVRSTPVIISLACSDGGGSAG